MTNRAEMVDRYGDVCAKLKTLETEKEVLRDLLIASAGGIGARWIVTVRKQGRTRIDSKALYKKYGKSVLKKLGIVTESETDYVRVVLRDDEP